MSADPDASREHIVLVLSDMSLAAPGGSGAEAAPPSIRVPCEATLSGHRTGLQSDFWDNLPTVHLGYRAAALEIPGDAAT